MKNFYRRAMLIIMFLLAMGFLVFLAMIQAKAATPKFYKSAFQQEVTGQVTGPTGEPLLGVTVLVKNKQYGTTTNKEGIYKLQAAASDTLVFSSIGFKKLEVPLQGRTSVDVQLQEDIASLGEVEINAGYYNTTKRESTGSISRVTAEEIENQPVVSPLQALQGRMPGVEVTSGGFQPGAASTIRIRGINSLREEGNYPLYIIDGVPFNSTPVETNSSLSYVGIDPLNNLDINNIQSIEILKDADATAIYGSRGANGVVLITTKKGTLGTGLQAKVYYGAATVPGRLDLLNTPEYIQVRQRAFENDSIQPTASNAPDLILWDQENYTDWQDFLYGSTAETSNTSLSFTGGDERTSFRFGGSYFTQGSIYPADYDYKKITGNIHMNHSSSENKFQLGVTLNYGVDSNDLVGSLGYDNSTLFLPPNAPEVFNEDGSLNWEDWGAAGLKNPLEGNFNTNNKETKNLISNVSLSYEVFPGLELKSSLGYTIYTSDELRKQPKRSYNPADAITHKSFHLRSDRKSWIIEPQINYENSFNKFHLKTLLGATFQENTSFHESFLAEGYASEALIGNIGAAEKITNGNRSNTEYHYDAVFSRVGVDWDQKYFLNLTGRRDGSSRFGPNNRFANFGAVGAAWIFGDEGFMQKTFPFLSFGKLRGSYGSTGNDQIGDYGYLDAYEATRGPGGLYPSGLANPNYSWEVNKKLEFALEMGFWNERVSFSLSRYKNRSSNQLVGYPLPYLTGFTSVQANLPATVENTGWELSLHAIPMEQQKFRWETSLNLSFPKNKLVSYPGIEESSYANTYRVGEPLNIELLYEYTGLDPQTGFYTVRDVNDDGRYDYKDRIVIKDRNRQFYGGIINNFRLGGFSFNFLWEFVKQEGIIPKFSYGNRGNALGYALSALKEEGPFQRISQTYASQQAHTYAYNSTFPYRNSSYWRLKTLTLAYNFPQNFTSKIGMKNCSLFLHGQNLWTITSYEGMDAENPYSVGIGNLRSVTAGIEVNF
ncbi:SusC/RagA family TonB-linked outer membrane protein [Christiangramia fulva]|uniref:SusC/RagA family TonB-linked outer membrane protein n=1 Tax=Christiangramia fulva TaxID=2126553 RepID=A0A2R3Z1S8_9FLAO|nr:SusC/RagA family TonB-linked outer membrane protein [Christiangramia fulva]AVR44240.1 SusC/RagA family TonB-linked outer membrane protein [Christiangramia fulva]